MYNMNGTDNIRKYYRQITEPDICDVARELLAERIIQETKERLECDCPHHHSQSHRSLHVIPDKQSWYCFGCGKGGDVLQLVEFIQSGTVTAGQSGNMPDSHRRARDYLAEKAGLPPLSSYGLSHEEIEKAEKHRLYELRIKDALTGLAGYYHKRLKENQEVLNWLKEKYAINDETIDDLLIGYADNNGVISYLCNDDNPFSKKDLAATGAFVPAGKDRLYPFFEKRITFPYWSRGRVVFMIGRKTPHTPDENREKGKYKKLPVHDEDKRPYIAEFVNNATLFNEDCLINKPGYIIITEGVTDCIALMQHGIPAVSPVTVRIRAADRDRLIPKMRGIETVYICQDNEISEAGLKGALQTARILTEHKINARLVTIPLSDQQKQAREGLFNKFGITTAVGPRELTKLLDGRSDEDIQEAKELFAKSKIDVNDFFASGNGKAEFRQLLSESCTPVELSIRSISPADGITSRLEPVLSEIATNSPLEQNRLLKLLRKQLGKAVPLSTLKEEVRLIRQSKRNEAMKEKKKAKRLNGSLPGSCRALVDEILIDTEQDNNTPDYAMAAEAAYIWFRNNGARFFYTGTGEPFMYFDNSIYRMDSSDRGRKRQYAAMLYKHTGIVPTSNGGNTFFEVLPSLAIIHGQMRDHFSWLYSDISNFTVWFNLNNHEHEIAKITPDGIEIISNGGNTDGIILDDSRKMKPLKFIKDASVEEADKLLADLLINNMTCSEEDRFLILSWLTCFLLIDFSGTKPMTRFEGPAGSGKTTASKLISALLYGEPQHKKATDAANYTDGSQNPLIVLDNIEVKQMTEDLTTFMLTSITGIAKEKRKSGTDSETVTERTKCLLNTTGIEPLYGELSEIQSRSFTVNFDIGNQDNECFIESDVIAAIQESRDLIISAIMKRTGEVLSMMRDGMRKQAMKLLHEELGNHDKRRCNEYLSLMYLMLLTGSSREHMEHGMSSLVPAFRKQIKNINRVSRETALESNHTIALMSTLFKAWKNAMKRNQEDIFNDNRTDRIREFEERYQIQFEEDGSLKELLSRELFVALKRVSKDFNLKFEMHSPRQFAQRFSNDIDIIREAGFDISVSHKRYGTRLYTIQAVDQSDRT